MGIAKSTSNQDYQHLLQNHDERLNSLIKEINELQDNDNSNDNIESEIIVNNKLNDGLKQYFESHKNVASIFIDKINSIKTDNLSDKVKENLQTLVTLLSSIEGSEKDSDEPPFHDLTEAANKSFLKIEKLIDEHKNLLMNIKT